MLDSNMYLYLFLHPQLDTYALIIGLVLLMVLMLYLVWQQPINITRQPPPPPPKSKTKQKIKESDDYKLAA